MGAAVFGGVAVGHTLVRHFRESRVIRKDIVAEG